MNLHLTFNWYKLQIKTFVLEWREEFHPYPRKAIEMTLQSNRKTTIARTERGLTISGTRITLYDIMDYLTNQYPPKFIRGLFNLTDEQINVALVYIQAHRAEVETEYKMVLKQCEELREYYEKRNSDLQARLAKKPPKTGMEAAWEKLQRQKATHQAGRESGA